MKKIILGLMTLICIVTMSYDFETNIKVGYDFFRHNTNIKNKEYSRGVLQSLPYDRGFVIGAEVYPLYFLDKKLKLGAGIEYNFGETTLRYQNKKKYYPSTMAPVYATLKYNFYKHNSGLNLYTFGRVGYAFAKEETRNSKVLYKNHKLKNTGGVYYGLGFGLDYKYFLAEILYDGKYYSRTRYIAIPQFSSIWEYFNKTPYTSYYFHHKVGIRLGLRLDTSDSSKPQIQNCTKCEEKVVEKIVKVEKIVEIPVEQTKEETPKQVSIKKQPKKNKKKVRKPRKTNVIKICEYVPIKKK
ncbi:hypothetical protein [Caviibacter abscessus]|uniref:hypothetical protein n=1 Tax=Caviibacter abscessus TaxID=1766719 RepID=UPI0008386E0F|nr:hypothetical protein [Caviibacter abscessus]